MLHYHPHYVFRQSKQNYRPNVIKLNFSFGKMQEVKLLVSDRVSSIQLKLTISSILKEVLRIIRMRDTISKIINFLRNVEYFIDTANKINVIYLNFVDKNYLKL